MSRLTEGSSARQAQEEAQAKQEAKDSAANSVVHPNPYALYVAFASTPTKRPLPAIEHEHDIWERVPTRLRYIAHNPLPSRAAEEAETRLGSFA